VISLWLAVAIAASAQTQGPDAGGAAPAPGSGSDGQAGLHRVEASDGSASAALPPDWHVTRAAGMAIDAVGPRGETASLGNVAVVRDPSGPAAAAKLGGVDMEMPYATPLPEKFVRLVRHADPASQISIINSTELKVAPQLGQCARIVGDISTKDGGPAKFETLFCSLPPDIARIYKNVFRFVSAPAKVAMQERPMLEAILTSLRLPQPMLQRLLAPVVGPPPGAGGGAPGGGRGGGGPGGPGGGPSGPGGPGGGSPSMSDIQARAAAQLKQETERSSADAIRNAESFDSLLRQ